MPAQAFQRIGRQRLHPVDLYHMIDWARDGWPEHEEDEMPRLARLKWHLLEMPERYHGRAMEQYAILMRARLVANVPWEGAFRSLERLVSEWGRSRKAAA